MNEKPSEWKRIDKYAIANGDWRIAKCFVDGTALYVLFGPEGERYGHFDSADDAKTFAAQLELGAQA